MFDVRQSVRVLVSILDVLRRCRCDDGNIAARGGKEEACKACLDNANFPPKMVIIPYGCYYALHENQRDDSLELHCKSCSTLRRVHLIKFLHTTRTLTDRLLFQFIATWAIYDLVEKTVSQIVQLATPLDMQDIVHRASLLLVRFLRAQNS